MHYLNFNDNIEEKNEDNKKANYRTIELLFKTK